MAISTIRWPILLELFSSLADESFFENDHSARRGKWASAVAME
jgi:hypothetical protein